MLKKKRFRNPFLNPFNKKKNLNPKFLDLNINTKRIYNISKNNLNILIFLHNLPKITTLRIPRKKNYIRDKKMHNLQKNNKKRTYLLDVEVEGRLVIVHILFKLGGIKKLAI